jgi:uncharacterized protein with GYD domain
VIFRIDPAVTKEFRRLNKGVTEKVVAFAKKVNASKIECSSDGGKFLKVVVRFGSFDMLRNVRAASRVEQEVSKLRSQA